MKRLRWLMPLCLVLLLCPAARAVDLAETQAEAYGVHAVEQALPDAAVETFGELMVSDTGNLTAQLEKLWTSVTGMSQDMLFSAARNGALLLLLAFLTALCGSVCDSELIQLSGVAAISALSLEHVSSCASVGIEALQALSDFSRVLLPCLCTAATAGGAITSAGAKYAASMLVLDGLISAELRFALPLLYAYTAVMLAGQATQEPLLQSIGGLLKQGVKWTLIVLTLLFTVYLSVTGILTGTVDAAAAKAAKTVLSSALPVVGSILSDASSTLLSGAQMLRNGVGAVGLLAVLAVCVTPYLTLGAHVVVYRLAGGISASFSEKRIGGVLKGFADVYGFLLGMVGSASLMLFVSVVSMMKAVTTG